MDGLDGVWLDTTGCAHLFGGEQAMLDDLVTRLERLGFGVRAALADTPGAAWAVARYGVNGTVVVRGHARSALALLPIAALRLGAGTAAGLSRLGLRSAGDLYEMPRAPLAARFSEDLILRLDQALGRVDEPISTDPREASISCACRLRRTGRSTRSHSRRARASDRPDLPSPRTRRARLSPARVHALPDRRDVAAGASRNIAPDPQSETFDPVVRAAPGYDRSRLRVEAMALVAPVTEPLAARQSAFPAGSRREAKQGSGHSPPGEGTLPSEGAGVLALSPSAPLADAELGQLIDRLGNRLGFDAVVRLAPRESFLPERVTREVPVFDKTAPCWSPPSSASRQPLRPLRLLARPEPVEAMALVASRPPAAQEMPDIPDRQLSEEGGPPMLFRWRRVVHRVQAAEGPERIAPEWWREDRSWVSGSRDYWRIEDADGRRFLALPRSAGKTSRSIALVPARPVRVKAIDDETRPLRRTSGHQQFQLPARRLASRRTGDPCGGAGARGGRGDRPQQHWRAWSAPILRLAKRVLSLLLGRGSISRTAPACSPIPPTGPPNGRLARLITLGRRRAVKGECRLTRGDVLHWGTGMIFIAVPPDDPPDSAHSEGRFSPRSCANWKLPFPATVSWPRIISTGAMTPVGWRCLARLAEACNTPMVATNDVHMHDPKRRELDRRADLVSARNAPSMKRATGCSPMPSGI